MLVVTLAAVGLLAVAQAVRRFLASRLGVRGVGWFRVSPEVLETRVSRRAVVVAAGPLVIYALVALAHGLAVPRVVDEPTLLVDPVGGMPAEAAGVQPGDRALAIDGRPLSSWAELVGRVQAARGRALRLLLRRGVAERTVTVASDATGKVGLRPRMRPRRTSAANRLARALVGPWRTVHSIVEAWVDALAGRRAAAVAGPVMILQLANDGDRGTRWMQLVALLAAQAMPLALITDMVVVAVSMRTARRQGR